MPNVDAMAMTPFNSQVDYPLTFGEWLKCRRKELDLTQIELAQRTSCTVFALRKIEAGERRPSKQLAELLAQALEIPIEDHTTFIKVARGELNIERLPSPVRILAPGFQIAEKPHLVLGNLPRPLTPFIGREPELAALGQLLQDPDCSLLTIIGPGGIGKTRLAIESASSQQTFFPGGVYYVSLDSINSPGFVIPAIAEVFGFSFLGAEDPEKQLLNHLGNRAGQPLLLLLDNLEHLLVHSYDHEANAGISALIPGLLERVPGLKILTTSRERINLKEEWVFELHGLPVPSSAEAGRVEDNSAAALFLQRARQLKMDFEILPEQRPAFVRICQLVEGMPLAIELAASWVRMFSVEEIAQEIALNLDFLSNRIRDVPERHRSLRAVFEHSWKNLSQEEREVLCRLAIFRGGFQRQAAEQIAGASLSVLSGLMNQTLLRLAATGRIELHELVRQYSLAHLMADPQAYEQAQKRHYDFFLLLAEAANRELKAGNQLEWLVRLEQERDNLRAALKWAIDYDRKAPGSELGLQMSGALRWYWRMRGHFHEGSRWLTEALQSCPEAPSEARARALSGLALLINALGDLSAALPPAEASVAICRTLGDQRGLAEALIIAGLTLIWEGDVLLGCERLEEAVQSARQSGDRWGEAHALYRLGISLADYRGDLTGLAMLTKSAAILEDLGEKYLYVSVLISQGIVDMTSGNYALAQARLEHGLALAEEIRHPWGIADALTNLGGLLRILGDYPGAQSSLEQAQQIYREHGTSIWEIDVLCALAENQIAQGDLTGARLHLQRAVNLIGSSNNQWLRALVWYFQGLLSYYEGQPEQAALLLENATRLDRESGYKPDLARSLVTLARARRALGQIELASDLALEGLSLFQALGHKLGVAVAFEELAAIRAAQGDEEQAASLSSQAGALRTAMGAPLPPVDRARLAQGR